MTRFALLLAVLAAPSFAQGVLFEPGVDGPGQRLRFVSERVRIEIDHQYASTVLEQQFENLTDQRLERIGNLMQYRLPLGGGQSDVAADIRDPRPIARVDSSSHQLSVDRIDPRHVHLRASGGAAGARDLVIDVETSAAPWQPSVVVHRDPGQDAYLVLQMAAPGKVEQSQVSGKDVTLVIDHSGSMTGPPLDQACAAAELVVRRLRDGDRVNVIAFDHNVDPLFAAPHPVLFLTDGQSDSEAALRVAAQDRGDARVFTLGLGHGVQKALLSRLASM